eukprot:TRINITY_DN16286_c0_g1_i1.p1 TRINITY_DN16286_c0_g1~~TRINITY_DN16286_c0_g1_i1.p1  ORF type:complete len:703 (+),score=115.79 TRINITY_DN16286_c0_g1_i1:727-2835(+)
METENGGAGNLSGRLMKNIVLRAKQCTDPKISFSELWSDDPPKDVEQRVQFLLKVVSGLVDYATTCTNIVAGSRDLVKTIKDEMNKIKTNLGEMENIFSEHIQVMDNHSRAREKKARTRMLTAGRQIVSTMRVRTRWELDVVEASKDENVSAWLGSGGLHSPTPITPGARRATVDVFSPLATIARRRKDDVLHELDYVQQLLPNSKIISAVDDWNFDQQSIPEDNVLVDVGMAILSQYTFSELNIPLTVFERLLTRVQAGYKDTPYHNKRHAADVLQSLHSMLKTSQIVSYATDMQLFSLLMAAVCHDYGHPGFDINLYKSLCPSAVSLFGDSPLENFHAVTAWEVLQEDLATCVSPATLTSIKKLFFSYILSTDTGRRRENVQKLAASPSIHFLLKIMLHAADISNPTKSKEAYLSWTAAVMTEFWCQGDVQKQLGLAVSPMCDVDTIDVAKCQLGFLGMMVKPIYDTLSNWFVFEEHSDNLMKNIALWSSVEKSSEAEAAIERFRSSYRNWSTAAVGPLQRAKHGASRMTTELRALLSQRSSSADAYQSKCDLCDYVEELFSLQLSEADFRSQIADACYATIPVSIPPPPARSTTHSQKSRRGKVHHPDHSYQFHGVEKRIEPMFSILKIDRQHMPLDSYPVRDVALASGNHPVGDYRLYPDSAGQPNRKLLPVVVSKPKVPLPPVPQNGTKSIPFRRFC